MKIENGVLRPQPGPQTQALASKADILICGGAAGGGKSVALILEPLRHLKNPDVKVACFMRESTLLTKPGSIWDKTKVIYPLFNGDSRERPYLDWRFPSGTKFTYSGMEQENDALKWKNTEITLLEFDQLEAFTEWQFWYLTSRLRSTSGVSGYVRASCNPDPDSFIVTLIDWYLDDNKEYADPEKSGVLRYFVRLDETMYWANDSRTLKEQMYDFGYAKDRIRPISFTFIPSTIFDNPILMREDPQYQAWLESLPEVDRERLLKGNWKVRPAAGKIFNRFKMKLIPRGELPKRFDKKVRSWDKAGTEGGKKDRTAGFKMSLTSDKFFAEHCIAERLNPTDREDLIEQTALLDGKRCDIVLEQEPGSSGKTDAQATTKMLAGYSVTTVRPTGPKIARWRPFATQCNAGNVYFVQDEWTEDALKELHNADGLPGHLDDITDAGSQAFNYLADDSSELLLGAV